MKDDRILLGHILQAVDDILEYAAEGEEAFKTDRKTQDAILRKLEIIGEAAKKLSPVVRTANPDIPWRRITGMRDKLIHDYFGVDLDLVWATIKTVLPTFRRRISEIRDELP